MQPSPVLFQCPLPWLRYRWISQLVMSGAAALWSLGLSVWLLSKGHRPDPVSLVVLLMVAPFGISAAVGLRRTGGKPELVLTRTQLRTHTELGGRLREVRVDEIRGVEVASRPSGRQALFVILDGGKARPFIDASALSSGALVMLVATLRRECGLPVPSSRA